MAITLNAFVNTATDNNTANMSWSHTVTAGASLLLIWIFRLGSTFSAGFPNYNGSAATSAGTAATDASSHVTSLHYVINPTSGTHTIGGNGMFAAGTFAVGVSQDLSGTDTTTPIQTYASEVVNGSNPNLTGIVSATGNLVIDGVGCQPKPGSITLAGSQTDAGNNNAFGNLQLICSQLAGAATVTMGETMASGSIAGHIAVSIAAASGGGFTPLFRRSLSGYGSGVGKRQPQGFAPRRGLLIPERLAA